MRFYVEQLGFEERYRLEDRFVVVGLDAFDLGLTAVAEVRPPGRAVLWLYSDDVDAEVDRLRAAGVEVKHEPADMDWGERMAIVLDPDGNDVCLGQRVGSES